ncbi:MAG: MBL fold metallo-hydrolase [Pyrinomonadaceae bacterium]
MRITKYIHSCLVIEKGLDRILFDPGLFSFVEGKVKPSQFQNILAIVLTHCHPDHIDDESLKEIIKNNPNTAVLANSEIVRKLAEKNIAAETFETGQRVVASFVLKAFDAPHEKILADEIPQNTAYTVDDNILHPGDSLSKNLYKLRGTPVLCLPVTAPWETEPQAFKFAAEIAPRFVIPIHDGYVKDFFLEKRYQTFDKFLGKEDIKFQWMSAAGDYFEA